MNNFTTKLQNQKQVRFAFNEDNFIDDNIDDDNNQKNNVLMNIKDYFNNMDKYIGLSVRTTVIATMAVLYSGPFCELSHVLQPPLAVLWVAGVMYYINTNE